MNFVTKVLCPHKIATLLPSTFLRIPFENQAVQFWKVYFDFGYYLLLIPFRFKWDRDNGAYFLHSNSVQKILCLLTSLLGGFYYILNIGQKFTSSTDGNRNSAMYFELAYYCCDTLYLLIMFAFFGQKGQEISQVFDELQESNKQFFSNPMGYRKTRFFAKIICYLCLLTLVLYILEVYTNSNVVTIERWLLHFEKDASVVFKIFSNASSHWIFIFLSVFSNLLERILNAFSDILFVMTVLLFRELVSNFRQSLLHNRTTADKALKHYRWLKDITAKINHLMSLVIGSFIFGNLPFYATNVFDTFRDSSNNFMRLRYLFYCSYFFSSIFLAAKSSKEVEEITTWLYKDENHSQIESTKLKVVLHEVNGQAIGLSSFGCITVSYGLFGSIVSLILTYALLKTQVQGPSIESPLQSFSFEQERRSTTMPIKISNNISWI